VTNARTNVAISAAEPVCNTVLPDSDDTPGTPCGFLLSERHQVPTSPSPFERETDHVGNRAVRV